MIKTHSYGLSIFFDADGVIAEYERDAYEGMHPKFCNEHQHYFRYCKRDDCAYALLLQFIEYGADVWILSKADAQYPWIKHDKIQWFQDHIPEIPLEKIIIAKSDKAETIKVKKKLKKLTKNMILIDDYNNNLQDWIDEGGIGIKYINGINNPNSFNGPKIYRSAIPSKIR